MTRIEVSGGMVRGPGRFAGGSDGHAERIAASRFTRSRPREANWGELKDLIETWTSRHSGQECEDTLLAAGVPCTRYRTVAETMSDPQVRARGTFSPVRAYKRAVYQGMTMSLDAHLDMVSAHTSILRDTPEHRAKVEAFLQRKHKK